MPLLTIETLIQAPPAACFDAARDMSLHRQTSRETGETIISGPIDGLLEPGVEVVFEGRHLGVRQQLGAKITEFDRPHRFVDEMTRGAFAQLRHEHEFLLHPSGTLMRDTLTWTSPLGPLGRIADILLVRRHLHAFLSLRCGRLKTHLEITHQIPIN